MHKCLALFFIGSLLVTSKLSAKACTDLDNNSCWTIVNQSHQKSSVRCTSPSWTLIALESMPAKSLQSTQFNSAYGDGLGFPEPGIAIECETKLADGRKAKLNFSSHGWGERFEVRVDDRQLQIRSRDSWHDNKDRKFSVPLSR